MMRCIGFCVVMVTDSISSIRSFTSGWSRNAHSAALWLCIPAATNLNFTFSMT